MPFLPPPTNLDGSLRPYSPAEVAALGIQWTGVRDGSTPTLSFEINANRAELTCNITPQFYDQACYYFLGHSKLYNNGLTDKLSRLLPYRLPGREGLICTKITKMSGLVFTGQKDSNGLPTYKKLGLSLLFESPKYHLKTDADTTWEYERYTEVDPGSVTSDTISTFGSNFKFKRDPAKPDPAALPNDILVPTNSVLKVQPKDTFTTTLWRVPEDMVKDDSDWMTKMYGDQDQGTIGLIGCVNAVELHGRAPGTLLLKGARRFLDVSPLGDGTFEYRVEYTWETLPSGFLNLWFASVDFPSVNGFYQATTGSYKNPKTDTVTDGTCLYNVRRLEEAYMPGVYA